MINYVFKLILCQYFLDIKIGAVALAVKNCWRQAPFSYTFFEILCEKMNLFKNKRTLIDYIKNIVFLLFYAVCFKSNKCCPVCSD